MGRGSSLRDAASAVTSSWLLHAYFRPWVLLLEADDGPGKSSGDAEVDCSVKAGDNSSLSATLPFLLLLPRFLRPLHQLEIAESLPGLLVSRSWDVASRHFVSASSFSALGGP